MLSDRGYEIPEIQQNVSYEDFRIMFNNKNIDLVINKGEKNENDVYIFLSI